MRLYILLGIVAGAWISSAHGQVLVLAEERTPQPTLPIKPVSNAALPLLKSPAKSPPKLLAGDSPVPEVRGIPTALVTTADADILAEEVRDWSGLAKRLRLLGENQVRPHAGLWKTLNNTGKDAVRTLEKDGTAKEARAVLLTELARLLADPELMHGLGCQEEDFSDPLLRQMFKDHVAGKSKDTAKAKTLHRALLETAFPFELKKRPGALRAMSSHDLKLVPAPAGSDGESMATTSTTANSVEAEFEEISPAQLSSPPRRILARAEPAPRAQPKPSKSGLGKNSPFGVPAIPPEDGKRETPRVASNLRATVSVPRLVGRLLVVFETGDQLTFVGNETKELMIPNTGELKYRFRGDSTFSRSVRWIPTRYRPSGDTNPPEINLSVSF